MKTGINRRYITLSVAFLGLIPLQRTAAQGPPQAKPVELLAEVDTGTAVAGTWTKSNGLLMVNAANGARIPLPWKPTAEYDFEVEFSRTSGDNSIALIFAAGKGQASFDIDGWGQHLAGIQNIDGRTIRDNPTRVPSTQLQNGRRYSATVRVRRDRIEVVLDGKTIATHRGDGSDLSLLNLWRLPQGNSIGLGAWNSATTFHKVTVRPISTDAPSDSSPPHGSTPSSPVDSSLAELSDEFDDPATLKNWQRIYQVERSNADQLAVYDIGHTRKGWLTMVPHTSSWYQDYRGVLAFKQVKGDFVATTSVHSTGRSGNGAPRSTYSLAGLMVRTPRNVTSRTWRPGGENYIFLSLGTARSPGQFQFEVKTTINSRSNLEVLPARGPDALIQIARIGPEFILLRKHGQQPWRVHQRYSRTDMPSELQIGFTVYTDFATVSRMRPAQHNNQVIRTGNPDLRASFDYFHARRPQVPSDLQGRSLVDRNSVPDSRLLQFLGDHAN